MTSSTGSDALCYSVHAAPSLLSLSSSPSGSGSRRRLRLYLCGLWLLGVLTSASHGLFYTDTKDNDLPRIGRRSGVNYVDNHHYAKPYYRSATAAAAAANRGFENVPDDGDNEEPAGLWKLPAPPKREQQPRLLRLTDDHNERERRHRRRNELNINDEVGVDADSGLARLFANVVRNQRFTSTAHRQEPADDNDALDEIVVDDTPAVAEASRGRRGGVEWSSASGNSGGLPSWISYRFGADGRYRRKTDFDKTEDERLALEDDPFYDESR